MAFCLIFFIKIILSFQLVKMRIENHIYIRHIMLYHFEKGWNAAQSFCDLNELFGEGTIQISFFPIETWWSTSSFFICEVCIARFELFEPSFNLAFADCSFAKKFVWSLVEIAKWKKVTKKSRNNYAPIQY